MPKKFTASGVVFESAVNVMDDVIDFTIDRHTDDMAAVAIYGKMRDCMAESRRHLRALLKKGWFKGKERDKCLARARELREAELLIGCMITVSKENAKTNELMLDNIKNVAGMEELMSRFKISYKGKH
jgi:uncharacterized protein YktB (UPF0637 family)